MSFLSRRTSRPDQRGGRANAGRRADSGYDDYDYAPDDYQQDDENWSPDEYFSPEGIKGRWAAGSRSGDRPGGQARRDSDRGYDSRGYDDRGYDDYGRGDYSSGDYGSGDYGAAPQRARGSAGRYGRDSYQQDSYAQDAYAQDEGYGGDDYATGAYDIPDGPDDDRGERTGGRRRRDRGDRGERRLRLGRRDKGNDIWPDDGVSDEDYWASVAADRPLNSASPALDGSPMNVVNNRPLARPTGAARPGSDSRLMADRSMGDRSMGDRSIGDRSMGASEARLPGDSRTGSGRLGPAPGQSGYLSGSQPGENSGPLARSGTGASPTRSATGPTPTRPAIMPNGTRPGTGANGARPAAGLAQPTIAQPTIAQPALAQPSLTQPAPAQPSFQPHNTRGSSGSGLSGGSSRQPDVPDWAERTERIDRVSPAGYPDPRMNGRGQLPGAHSRTNGSTGWRGTDDDPLTSKAFSREALVNTDGRSYRVASRRAQVSSDRYEAALTEQTQTFTMNGQYQADSQASVARYPGRDGQQPSQQPVQRPRHAAQPQRPQLPPSDGHGGAQGAGASGGSRNPYDRGTGSYPYPSQPYPSRSGAREADEHRYGQHARPGGYDTGYAGTANGNGNGSYSSNRTYNGNSDSDGYNNEYGRYNGNIGYTGGYGDSRGGNGRR